MDTNARRGTRIVSGLLLAGASGLLALLLTGMTDLASNSEAEAVKTPVVAEEGEGQETPGAAVEPSPSLATRDDLPVSTRREVFAIARRYEEEAARVTEASYPAKLIPADPADARLYLAKRKEVRRQAREDWRESVETRYKLTAAQLGAIEAEGRDQEWSVAEIAEEVESRPFVVTEAGRVRGAGHSRGSRQRLAP